MKGLLLLLLISTTAFAADISGKWQLHTSLYGKDINSVCEFTQRDNELTGVCKTDETTNELTGKVDGKKITWSFKGEKDDGTPITINYEGTLDDNKIVGTVTIPGLSIDGDFSATQAK